MKEVKRKFVQYLIFFFKIDRSRITKQDLISGKFLTNQCPQNWNSSGSTANDWFFSQILNKNTHSDIMWKSADLWLPLRNPEEMWLNNAKAAFGRIINTIYITKAHNLIQSNKQTTHNPSRTRKQKHFKSPMSRQTLEKVQRLKAFNPL